MLATLRNSVKMLPASLTLPLKDGFEYSVRLGA
jgi:hypothetical protein